MHERSLEGDLLLLLLRELSRRRSSHHSLHIIAMWRGGIGQNRVLDGFCMSSESSVLSILVLWSFLDMCQRREFEQMGGRVADVPNQGHESLKHE